MVRNWWVGRCWYNRDILKISGAFLLLSPAGRHAAWTTNLLSLWSGLSFPCRKHCREKNGLQRRQAQVKGDRAARPELLWRCALPAAPLTVQDTPFHRRGPPGNNRTTVTRQQLLGIHTADRTAQILTSRKTKVVHKSSDKPSKETHKWYKLHHRFHRRLLYSRSLKETYCRNTSGRDQTFSESQCLA